MGNCCGSEENDKDGPDANERRRLQVEAAEKRHNENAARGLKDPEGARRRMETKAAASAAMERGERGGGTEGGGMKWQVN